MIDVFSLSMSVLVKFINFIDFSKKSPLGFIDFFY